MILKVAAGRGGGGVRIPNLQFEEISNLTHVAGCLRAHRCAGVSKRNIPSFFRIKEQAQPDVQPNPKKSRKDGAML